MDTREYLEVFNKIEDTEWRFRCPSDKKKLAEHKKTISFLKIRLNNIIQNS